MPTTNLYHLLSRIPAWLLCIALSVLILIGPFAVDHYMLYATQYGQLFFSLKITLLIAIFLTANLSFTTHIKPAITDGLILLSVLFVTIQAYIAYNYHPPFNLITFFIPVIAYLGFRCAKPQWAVYFYISLLLAGTAEALYGNMQLYGFLRSYNDYFTMTGSFFNPAPFAGYLALILPVVAGCWLYRHQFNNHPLQQRLLSIFVPLCAITIIAVLPAARSRASWFAATAGVIYLVLTYPGIRRQLRNKITAHNRYLWAFIAVSLIAIMFLLAYQLRKDSANGRLLIWKVSAGLFTEHPITGAGLDKFKKDYMQQQATYLLSGHAGAQDHQLADNVQYAYNEMIHVALEHGIFGLILMIVILYFTFIPSPNGHNAYKYIYMARGGLLSLLVFSLFSYPTDVLPILIIGAFYLATITLHTNNAQALTMKILSLPRAVGIAIAIITIVAVAYIGPYTFKSERAFRYWGTAHRYYQNGDYSGSLQYYTAAVPEMFYNAQFLNHYGKALYMTKHYQESITIEEQSMHYGQDMFTYMTLGDDYAALNNFQLAESCYQKAADMVPSHFYPRYCLVNMYYRSHQYGKAKMMAESLLRMPVKVESEATGQIRTEMQQLIVKLNRRPTL